MFDPHRTRRSDSRYYTRKGQVLQASLVNPNPVIDQRLVPIYQNYINKNNRISAPAPVNIQIDCIRISQKNPSPSKSVDIYLKDMTVSTETYVVVDFRPTQNDQAGVVLYKNTSGDIIFTFVPFRDITPGDPPPTKSVVINGNVKCYYKLIQQNFKLEDDYTSDKILMSNGKEIFKFISFSVDNNDEKYLLSHEIPISI